MPPTGEAKYLRIRIEELCLNAICDKYRYDIDNVPQVEEQQPYIHGTVVAM